MFTKSPREKKVFSRPLFFFPQREYARAVRVFSWGTRGKGEDLMAVETLRDVIRHSAAAYGSQTAFRYKIGRKELEDKTYENVNQDSMAVSRMLKAEGMLGKHIALIGATTYSWIISYFGITNSGSVAVPIDAQLPSQVGDAFPFQFAQVVAEDRGFARFDGQLGIERFQQ